MSALTEFLYPLPARRSAGGIIRWWERRRLGYNLAVGAAGLVSLGVINVIALVPPALPGPIGHWLPIVVFAVMANVCYLLGPAAEIAVEKLSRGRILPIGPVLYRMGLTFSVGLALFPALLFAIAWVVRVALLVA